MQIYCNLCHHVIIEEEEVRFTANAYWHELGSKTIYSVSRPHHVDKDSIRHADCEEYYGEETQP